MKKTIVYIPGCWDLLHVGHVAILEKAKAAGDILIVGVPTDEVVLEDKKCLPIITCVQRIRMLEALKCVDMALPYDKLEFLTALRKYDVDILVIGEQWGKAKRHMEAVAYIKEKGGKIVQFPYSKEISTTEIKKKIIEQWGRG